MLLSRTTLILLVVALLGWHPLTTKAQPQSNEVIEKATKAPTQAGKKNAKKSKKSKESKGTKKGKASKANQDDLEISENLDNNFNPDPVESDAADNPFVSNVINGDDVESNEEFPYYVRVYKNLPDGMVVGCGGTLIAPDTVLSAAHCEWSNESPGSKPGDMITNGNDIYVGAFNNSGASGQRRTCIEWINHPTWEGSVVSNVDLALCKLDRPVAIDQSKIRLLINRDDAVPNNQYLQIAGFGSTGRVDVPEILQWGEVVASTCTDYTNWVCVQKKVGGTEVCAGDSGGPLVRVFKPHHSQAAIHYIVGVTSYGDLCEVGKEQEGYYARVSTQREWIHKTMCKKWDKEEKDKKSFEDKSIDASCTTTTSMKETKKVMVLNNRWLGRGLDKSNLKDECLARAKGNVYCDRPYKISVRESTGECYCSRNSKSGYKPWWADSISYEEAPQLLKTGDYITIKSTRRNSLGGGVGGWASITKDPGLYQIVSWDTRKPPYGIYDKSSKYRLKWANGGNSFLYASIHGKAGFHTDSTVSNDAKYIWYVTKEDSYNSDFRIRDGDTVTFKNDAYPDYYLYKDNNDVSVGHNEKGDKTQWIIEKVH